MTRALAETLKAVADPLRLRILALLGREELAVGELAEVLGISQPRVSHHLKILRETGWLQIRREGSWTFCRLAGPEAGGPLHRALGEEVAPGVEDLERLSRALEARRERSRAFFQAAAGGEGPAGFHPPGQALLFQALACLVPPGLVVADIGCGTGALARVLAARASRIVLVDHAPAMLERARAALAGVGPAVLELRLGEVDDLPLADGEAGAAFAGQVLHHAPNLKAALVELARVVAPGGVLVVTDLMPHEEEWLREESADLRLGLDPRALAGIAREAGFGPAAVEAGAEGLRVTGRNGREALLPAFVLWTRKEGGAGPAPATHPSDQNPIERQGKRLP